MNRDYLDDRCSAFTSKDANEIYDALIERCGARERWRADFVYCLTELHQNYEFRFQGLLGFGGKFKFDRSHGAYVDCYREDLTDERVGMICRINQWLKARVVRS